MLTPDIADTGTDRVSDFELTAAAAAAAAVDIMEYLMLVVRGCSVDRKANSNPPPGRGCEADPDNAPVAPAAVAAAAAAAADAAVAAVAAAAEPEEALFAPGADNSIDGDGVDDGTGAGTAAAVDIAGAG